MSLKKLLLSLSLVTFCLLPLAGCAKEEAKKDTRPSAPGDMLGSPFHPGADDTPPPAPGIDDMPDTDTSRT